MSKITLLIIVFILACCSPNREGKNQLVDRLPDSLFRFSNLKLIRQSDLSKVYDSKTRLYSLHLLSESQKKIYTDKMMNTGDSSNYNAYFFSKQQIGADFNAILVYLQTTDINSIFLLSISDQDVVKGYVNLTSDKCILVDQDQSKETVLCDQKYARFINDSTLQVIEIRQKTYDYGQGKKESMIDSITNKYSINRAGYIKYLGKDSLRAK